MSPGFLDQQYARRHIPRIQPFFPHSVKTPAGNVGQVDRSRAVTPDTTGFEQKLGEMPGKILAAFKIIWEPSNDQSFAKVLSLGNPDRLSIKTGSSAAFGGKK